MDKEECSYYRKYQSNKSIDNNNTTIIRLLLLLQLIQLIDEVMKMNKIYSVIKSNILAHFL